MVACSGALHWFFFKVGGWVGEWLSYVYTARKVEENEAVRMSYCGLGMGGWVGGWMKE